MIVANVYLNPLKAHSHSFLRPFPIMYFAFRHHMHVVAHNDQYLFCPLHIQENICSITPLSAQISASRLQNLSQIPRKNCGVYKIVVFDSNTMIFSVVNAPEIVVLITNVILWRGEIWNLAQTPWNNLKTHKAIAE